MNLILVGGALLALAGQAVSPARHLPKILEEEGSDPPALVGPTGFSPRTIVSWDGFTSYQVNVNNLGQNIMGDAANEPSLCVDPSDADHIAIGWRQFDSVTSNFRQGGYGYSTDGGMTWTFPGVLENNVFRSDPVLGSRYDSTFYYLSLLTTFYDTLWGSTNGGASWSQVGPAEGGDKEWFTIDNSFSVGRGNMYQAWDTTSPYNGQFTRSVDGGATWMTPIGLSGQPVFGVLDVDTSGTLYLCGSGNSGPEVLRSSNAKFAAQTPTFDRATTVNLGGDLGYGLTINPGGLSGQMWIAVDKSSSASPQPLYTLASIVGNSSNPCDVMFSRSLDGDTTWGSAIRVNDDPLNSGHYHWFGTLSVSPTGRLDAIWNDTRDDSSHGTSALYYAFSLDGGQHFSANIRISPSFNQSLGYPNQNKMGDYIGMVSNSVGANIAYAATFNSEEDVYYMLIPSPVVVAPTAVTVNHASYTGTVGSLAAVDGNYLVMGAANFNVSIAPVEIIVDGTSPSLSPKALLFTLVSHDSLAPQSMILSFFNWQTNSYEAIKTMTSTASDSFVSSEASGDLSRFVRSDGAIRAKLTLPHTPVGAVAFWRDYFDQAVWDVIP